MQASNLRFATAHLFYALFLSASATSLFGAFGLLIACFVGIIWWQVLSGAMRESTPENEPHDALSQSLDSAPRKKVSGRLTSLHRNAVSRIELSAVLIVVGLLVGLLIPAQDESDPVQQAENSMRMVAKAVQEYELMHGQLPTVVCDSDGTPIHSWRALVLKELGERNLAEAYRLDEPWNGPNNSQLLDFRPWHYRPFYDDESYEQTQSTLHLIGTPNGPLLVDHEAHARPWLAPDELTAQQWCKANRVPSEDQGFWHQGFFASSYRGRLAARDKHVFQIHPSPPRAIDELTALDTRSANTRIVIGQPTTIPHFGTAFRLAFFLAVALYPIRWLKRIRTENHTTAVSHR